MSLFGLSLALPLLFIALLLFQRARPLSSIASLSILCGFAFALLVPIGSSFSIEWFLLGLEFEVDQTAKLFLLLTTFIWFFSSIYSSVYIKEYKQSFWILFLATYLGNFGLCFASDAIGFYLFFTLMSLSAFGLIMHQRDEEAKDAAILYIKFAIFGEILVFLAIIYSVYFYQGFSFSGNYASLPWGVVLLILVGFGIKAGMFLLHPWLPLAHSKAPAPVSAVLSAVMLKAGILGWIRFLPLGETSYEILGVIMIVLGFFGVFGGIYGITQRGIKQILAYSSISQMGYLVVAVGMILLYPQIKEAVITAIVFFAIHHGLVKASLFLLAGEIQKEGFSKINSFLSVLAALILIGVPLTSGAMAKEMLKYSLESDFIIFLLGLGSIVTALLMLTFLLRSAKILPKRSNRLNKLSIIPLLLASVILPLVTSQSFSFDVMQVVPLVAAFLFYSYLNEKKIQIKQLPTSDIATLFTLRFDKTKLEKPLRLPTFNPQHWQAKNHTIINQIEDQNKVFFIALCFIIVISASALLF